MLAPRLASVRLDITRYRRPAAALIAAAVAAVPISASAAEPTYVGVTGSSWSLPTNWSTGAVPQAGDVADVFAGVRVTYDVGQSPPADLAAVQVAGGTAAAPATIVFAQTSSGPPILQAGGLFLGGTATGTGGRMTGTGPGAVVQQVGTVAVDAGGPGLVLDPTGTYTLNGGTLSADAVANAGTFMLAGGSVGGTTTPAAVAFANTGVLTVAATAAAGSLPGTVTNGAAGAINVLGPASAFAGSIVDNGQLTFNGSAGTYSAPLTGNGSVVVAGGTVTIGGGAAAFTGQTAVRGGTLTLAAATGPAIGGPVVLASGATLVDGADQQLQPTTALTVNGGTFNLNGHVEMVGSLALTGGTVTQTPGGLGLGVGTGALTVTRGSPTIVGGLRTAGAYAVSVAPSATLAVGGTFASTAAGTAVPDLVLTGGGTLALAGASPLVLLDVESGTAQLASGGTLGGLNQQVIVAAAGLLNVNNQALTVANLTGTGRVLLGTGTLTVDPPAAGSTFAGSVGGTGGSLTLAGPGPLTLSGADSYTGSTTINAAGLTLPAGASLATTTITVGPATTLALAGSLTGTPALTDTGTVTVAANTAATPAVRAFGPIAIAAQFTAGTTTVGQFTVGGVTPTAGVGRTLIVAGGLTFATPLTSQQGAAGTLLGQLNLGDNDLVVRNGNLGTVAAQVIAGNAGGTFAGPGIASSAAAADATHLTAVAAIANNDGAGNVLYGPSTSLGLFDGYAPAAGDVLVRYTYYGDANLDGVVNGADYARVDAGFASKGALTGWYNGDFNYDGVVDASDYTLIDNAFNKQRGNLVTGVGLRSSAITADTTDEVAAVTAVPEPAAVATSLAIGAATMLRRRRSVGR